MAWRTMLDRSRARRNLPALGAAALAFAAGCTGSSAPPEGAATGCLGGRAKPLSGEVVVAALREQGFSARAMTTSELCRALNASLPECDRAAFHVTNEESGSWAEVRERQGIASCVVRKWPIWGRRCEANRTRPRRRRPSAVTRRRSRSRTSPARCTRAGRARALRSLACAER